MLRKAIVFIVTAVLLLLPGCDAESTSAAIPTEPAAVTTVPTEPTIATESTKPENKMYKVYDLNGMQIRLPPTFTLLDSSQPIILDNWYCCIIVHREAVSSHPALPEMPLEEYAEALMGFSNVDAKLEWVDGILCQDYELPATNGTYSNYWATFFKTDTDFWIVEFVCDAREADKMRVQFMQWAKTIEFTKAEQSLV